VIVDALLGGELLEPGSADERLVEDDGSVLLLAPCGSALGCPLRGVSRPSHIFSVGLRKLG
jgi:hypothetical protein